MIIDGNLFISSILGSCRIIHNHIGLITESEPSIRSEYLYLLLLSFKDDEFNRNFVEVSSV